MDCGRFFDLPTRDHGQTCQCGAVLKRDYSTVQIGGNPAFQEHFNHAVGKVVSSDKQFRDELKRGGEKAGSEYVPIYPGDQARPTKDDHVFETQERNWRDRGLTRSKSTTIPLGPLTHKDNQ